MTIRTPQRLTWKQTRARIRADHQRLVAFTEVHRPDAPSLVWCSPAFLSVLLYRLASHLYRARHHRLARLVWHLNLILTGADISEPADIGEGLLVPTPAGVALMGVIGRNLTVMACAGVGGELGRTDDIGAGPGLPVIGDDVTLEPHAGVLGPVRIGNEVLVRAGAVAIRDIPSGSIVEAPRARIIPPPPESPDA